MQLKTYFFILSNEIKKDMIMIWNNKIQWVAEFFALFLLYYYVSNIIQISDYDSRYSIDSSIRYTTWFFAVMLIGDLNYKISIEMKQGTLENLFLACTPFLYILISKSFSSIFRNFVLMLILFLIICLFFNSLDHKHQLIRLLVILVFLTPGLLGMGLFFAGINICFKDTAFLHNITNNAMLFICGVFVPVNTLPQHVRVIASCFPLTWANYALNADKSSPLIDSNVFYLFFMSSVYIAFGVFLFLLFKRLATTKGLLSYY